MGLQMCGMASLDVEERGWSGKSSQGKNLRLLQHHSNHFSEVHDGMQLFLGVTGYFKALIGTSGFKYRYGLPVYG